MNDFGIKQGIRRKGGQGNDIRVVRSPEEQKGSNSYLNALKKYTTNDPWLAAEWML